MRPQPIQGPPPTPEWAFRPQVSIKRGRWPTKRLSLCWAQLKDDPKNADLMIQLGNIYYATHQFKEAADYFGKSLEVKPKNTAIRTELASCLYYAGDVDGALRQLSQETTDDPKDANSLFNLGMIRWKGKNDSKGALAAWAQLLKANPQLEPGQESTGPEADGRRPTG